MIVIQLIKSIGISFNMHFINYYH